MGKAGKKRSETIASTERDSIMENRDGMYGRNDLIGNGLYG